MPPRLCLHVLGPPKIELDNEPLTLERRKAQALLAYLAIESGGHSRESLSTLLWPDYSQSNAFKNLRQILWEIQKTVGEGWLIVDREKVQLADDVARVWLDVREFESLFAKSRLQEDASLRLPLLADSARLYRNHFLTGFSLKDAHPFNDWAFAKSEDLRHDFSLILNQLSEDYCAIGQASQAIHHARRLVSLDPLNEAAHRQLMQVYIQAGQHSAALKQYQVCEQILRKELNLDPQPETRELYKKIRKGEAKPAHIEKRPEVRVPQHNLPHQLSTFIRREKEEKTIARLIAGHRLVTLIGAGGIGKTRLSLEVGKQLVEQFAHGVWLVELASLSDPSLVPQAVGSLFDIVERSENTLSERLTHFLQSKTALLILDNCEHLIEACARLAEVLLAGCPGLKILATSREALGVPGEALYRVPSLSMPKAKQDSDGLASFESVRLFADRARLSVSEFSLTKENVQVVAQICRRLDGIPLAIELAAARVSTLSVEQIAARLDDSFKLLAGSSRTRLARQQTLQASIEWSWDLLPDAERVLLRRLSIFAGGWTLDAAESVCEGGGVDPEQVLDLLTQLVVKSLVVVDQESGGARRYHLLEMIRQYAREKLVQSGEEQRVAEWHLDYFLQLSEKIDSGVIGPQQAEWFARAKQERDNLRVALTFASRNNLVEAGLYLSARLYRLWESLDMQEGVHWLAEFVEKPESKNYPHARARALCMYGWLLIWRQQFLQAQPFIQEALEQFRAHEDTQGEINALILLGNITEFRGDMTGALEIYQHALKLSQSVGDIWGEAQAHFMLGYDRRNMESAFYHLEKAVALFRESGDWAALANSLGVLGTFRVLNGDADLGQRYLDEAEQLWRFNKRVDIWENAKVAKSRLAILQGDYEQAQSLLQEMLLVAEETGNRMSYLWNRAHLGQAVLRAGNLAEARRIFAETIRDFEKDGNTIGVVFGIEGMASLLIVAGKPEKAARLIGCADATRESIPDVRPRIEEADMYRNMAAILSRIGPSGFEVTYDEGRSMSLEEAARYALEED